MHAAGGYELFQWVIVFIRILLLFGGMFGKKYLLCLYFLGILNYSSLKLAEILSANKYVFLFLFVRNRIVYNIL